MTMSLVGTFDVGDFSDIVNLFERRESTGKLQVRAGSLHAAIRLVGGQAAAAEANNVGWRDIKRDWRGALLDICFEILRAGRGTFEFQPDEGHGVQPEPHVKLADVTQAAQERLVEWREVEAVIPSLSAVPSLADGLRSESLTFNVEQWRIVVAIDGRRTVSQIGRRLEADPLLVCRLLKPMVEDGAVVLERSDVTPKVGPLRREDGVVAAEKETGPTGPGSIDADAAAATAESAPASLASSDGGEPRPTTEGEVELKRLSSRIPSLRARPRPPAGLPASAPTSG
jgi:Domain of unknown function (DUF4388)